MRRRLISAVLLIGLVGLTIYCFPDWIFGLVAMTMIAVGLYEFYRLIETKGILIYKYIGILVGLSIPLSIYLDFKLTRGWELFFIVAVCLSLFIMQLTRKENSQAIVGISTTIFGVIYISWFFSFLVKLKLFSGGAGLIAYLLMVTKSGDMGAFLIGSKLGSHPLIYRISPNKTVEGSVGGFLSSLTVAIFCRGLLPGITIVHAAMLGALLGMAAQLGDLFESMIKRDCRVKDTGKLFPGLGGMLDIIDSILFTAPIFYFYVKLVLLP